MIRWLARAPRWARWVVLGVGSANALLLALLVLNSLPDAHLVRTIKDQGVVWGIAFSHDGQLLATGDDDGIHLLRVADGQLLRTLIARSDAGGPLAFSPNDTILASGGAEQIVRLWQVSNGHLLRSLPFDRPAAVAFSPDGQLVATGGNEERISLWRVSDGHLVRALQGDVDFSQAITGIVFSPDGQTIVSGGAGVAYLWRVADGKLLRRYETATTRSSIWSIALSPDGGTLALGRRDGTIQLWSVSDGRLRAEFGAARARVYSVAFSPDGQFLASAGGPIRPRDQECLLCPNRKDDTRIRVWRVADRKPVLVLRGHREIVNSVAFSPNGQFLASGSDDGTIRLWRLREQP